MLPETIPPLAFIRVILSAVAMAAIIIGLVTANSAGVPSESTYFDQAAVPQPPDRLWDLDTNPVELGMKVTFSEPGYVLGVRFYKGGPTNGGTHTGSVWSRRGWLLRTAAFSEETPSGWQRVLFSEPLPVEAGRTIVVSYFASNGNYSASNGYFSDATSKDILTTEPGAGVYRYGASGGFPSLSYQNTNYWVDVVYSPNPIPTPTPTPTPTPSPTPSPTPTPTQPTPSSTPTPTSTPAGDFPDAENTGVPKGTTLTPYTGPCVVTQAGTVIDGKSIECDLIVRGTGVRISNSLVVGSISNESSASSRLIITDTEIRVGSRPATGIAAGNFTATRVHVTGGNRSILCEIDCTVADSYVHGQFTDTTGVAHESGIRMGQNAVIRHNTITCDAPDVPPDAGCSAGLTGYGDFGPVRNNLIAGNLFLATTGGFCAYGGSTQNKPYSNETQGIVFRDNTFERGQSARCGKWGPITSFNESLPGNIWSGNVWTDGRPVPPAN